MNELKKRYSELNNSYQKTLVFHLGESAGFYSEYNCMIFAMLYCLEHKIRFVLYSQKANFGYKNGWTDFFLPFCEEVSPAYHKYLNMRAPDRINLKRCNINTIKWVVKKRLLYYLAKLSKPFLPFNYYTQDLWNCFFDKKMVEKKYVIPELSINGDITHACNRLVELTWHYNEETQQEINNIIKNLHLPDNYFSCHIRGGDKFIEYPLLSVEPYIEKLNCFSGDKNLFVLTDDYKIIKNLNCVQTSTKIYTLCQPQEAGYIHADFKEQDNEKKRNQLITLFASIEILAQSKMFIGTKTSNPGIFLSMYKPYITKGVDYDEPLLKFYFDDK